MGRPPAFLGGRVEMPAIAEKIGAARAEGDLKENAEYHAQREAQGLLQARINLIKSKLAKAHIIDPSTLRAAMHDCFDAGTLAKGRVYQMQKRVLSCTVGRLGAGWGIAAEVRGSTAPRYEVSIDIANKDGAPSIQGECSCPMRHDCKHVAAVMLHILQQPGQWFNPAASVSLPAADGTRNNLESSGALRAVPPC